MADPRVIGPTDEQAEAFFAEITRGRTIGAAAARAGFSERVVHKWLKLGRDALDRAEAGEPLSGKDRLLAAFAERHELAWNLAEAELHDRADALAEKGMSTWTQPITVMERTRPAKWGRRQDVTVEHRAPAVPAVIQVVVAADGRVLEQQRAAGVLAAPVLELEAGDDE